MTSLKSLLGEAARSGLIAYNPATAVKMRDAKRHKRKIMIGRDIPTKARFSLIRESTGDNEDAG